MSTILNILSPMILVFTLHLVGGFFGMYNWFPEIDNLLHFFGGAATAMSALLAQQWGDIMGTIPSIRGLLRGVLGVGLVALVAMLWELLEFAFDQIVPGARFQDGLVDTMIDLAMGLLGALVVFAIHAVRGEKVQYSGGQTQR